MRKGLDNQTSGQNWWGESIGASLPWPCRGMWAADTGGSSALVACREQLLLHRPRKAHQRRNTILDSEDISQPFLLISLIFTAVTWLAPRASPVTHPALDTPLLPQELQSSTTPHIHCWALLFIYYPAQGILGPGTHSDRICQDWFNFPWG